PEGGYHTIWCWPPKDKGFPQRAVGALVFADRPQDAPIVHFGGPLTLAIFDWHKPLQPRQLVRSDRDKEYSILVGTPAFGCKHEVFAIVNVCFRKLDDGGGRAVMVEFP